MTTATTAIRRRLTRYRTIVMPGSKPSAAGMGAPAEAARREEKLFHDVRREIVDRRTERLEHDTLDARIDRGRTLPVKERNARGSVGEHRFGLHQDVRPF